jgi:hypothetical protein
VVTHVTVQEHDDKKSLNSSGGGELMKRLGGSEALPYFAFLDSKGELIVNSNAPPKDGKKGGNIGHPYEPDEVDWFMAMVAKAAPRITADESAALEKYLRAQKK